MTKSVASLIAQQQRELHQAEKQQQQQQQQHNEKPPRAVASYSRRPRGDSGSSAAGGGANDDVDDESLGSVAATRVPSSRYRTSRGGSFHRFGSGVGMATTDGDDEESSASTTSAAETALSTFGPVVKLNVGGTIYQTRLALLRTVC
jgi:hypothetical protein